MHAELGWALGGGRRGGTPHRHALRPPLAAVHPAAVGRLGARVASPRPAAAGQGPPAVRRRLGGWWKIGKERRGKVGLAPPQLVAVVAPPAPPFRQRQPAGRPRPKPPRTARRLGRHPVQLLKLTLHVRHLGVHQVEDGGTPPVSSSGRGQRAPVRHTRPVHRAPQGGAGGRGGTAGGRHRRGRRVAVAHAGGAGAGRFCATPPPSPGCTHPPGRGT